VRSSDADTPPEFEEDGDDVPAVSDDDDGEPTSGPRLSPEQTLRKECGFSQSLVDDLKAHRLQITRAHLAGDFDVAFDLALYALSIDLGSAVRDRESLSEGRVRRLCSR
jgi:ParB family chromosome partitioning protein